MVQAADFGKLHDLARLGELDRPDIWSVLGEGEMGARSVVVSEVAGQDAAEVSLAENEHVIQALAPDRTDQALSEWILPRAVRCRENFLDPHALRAVPKWLTVDAVAVAEEIGRSGIVWEGVHELLGGPVGGGMFGNVEVDDALPVMGKHDQDEEDAEVRGRHREEVEGNQIAGMVGEKRPPGLRRQRAPLWHEPRDGALRDVDSEPNKFP
jgi:hypothetical protein